MLVDGDDHNEPVADAVRGILDGHIVMERAIAERGRYPAINILKSISRTMPRAADPAYLPVINRARQVMATYADMEELIRLGAYRPGSSAEVDEAIRLHKPLEDFLRQVKEEATSLAEGYQRLEQILADRGNRKLTLLGHHSRPLNGPAASARAAECRRAGAEIGASGSIESMKSRETLIRLKKFQVDEKRRKVAQIEAMIAEFERIAGDLDREIKIEQDRAGIHDPAHFAYPTYAKAAIARRENLKRSADELRVQLDDAKAALGEAFEELKKVEMLDERDQAREKAEANAREQSELDRIAGLRFNAGGVRA